MDQEGLALSCTMTLKGNKVVLLAKRGDVVREHVFTQHGEAEAEELYFGLLQRHSYVGNLVKWITHPTMRFRRGSL